MSRRIYTTRLPTPPEMGFPFFFPPQAGQRGGGPPFGFRGPPPPNFRGPGGGGGGEGGNEPPPLFGNGDGPFEGGPSPNGFGGHFRPPPPPHDFNPEFRGPPPRGFNPDGFRGPPPHGFNPEFGRPPPHGFNPEFMGPPPPHGFNPDSNMFGGPPSFHDHPMFGQFNRFKKKKKADDGVNEERRARLATQDDDDNESEGMVEAEEVEKEQEGEGEGEDAYEDDKEEDEESDKQLSDTKGNLNEYDEEEAFADKLFDYLNTPTRPSPKKQFMQNMPASKLILDPNYKWLLKDLNLSNEKRVIDVTHILSDEKLVKEKMMNDEENEEKEKESAAAAAGEKSVVGSREGSPKKKKKAPPRKKLIDEPAVTTTTKTAEQTNNTNNEDSKLNETNTNTEEDSNFISKLYEKLVASNSNRNDSQATAGGLDLDEDDDIDDVDEDFNDAFSNIIDKDQNSDHDATDKTGKAAYVEWSKRNEEKKATKPTKETAMAPRVEDVDEESSGEGSASEKKNKNKKKEPKFSKSFEVSLGDLDEMIERVDGGIKLKRANNNGVSNKTDTDGVAAASAIARQPATAVVKPATETADRIDVDSLKKEWSSMFSKLENDYKQKLDEQQRLNDQKLKSLHDDIKQSILLQQQHSEKSAPVAEKPVQPRLIQLTKEPPIELNSLKPTLTATTIAAKSEEHANENLNDTEDSSSRSAANANNNNIPIITNMNINTASSVVDNAKYISNLRLELKTKHARHVQDLKDYYEKEIEDLSKKLDAYKSMHSSSSSSSDRPLVSGVVKNNNNNNGKKKATSGGSSSDYDYVEDLEINSRLYENLTKTNEDYLKLNSDLNNANSKLLDKLSQANQHINYLTHENLELKKKLDDQDLAGKNSSIKIANLENCVSQLEAQLTDSLKLQDEYMRELHAEKRNSIKKIQDAEELKLAVKFLEQKCANFEAKIDEKESFITRLKQKYIQLEQETNRIEYEYQRLRNNQTTINLANTASPTSNNSNTNGKANRNSLNANLSSYPFPSCQTNSTTSSTNFNPSSSSQKPATELPIRHEQKQRINHTALVNNLLSTTSPSSGSSSSSNSPKNNNNNYQTSPQSLSSKSQSTIQPHKTPNLLTIVCSLDQEKNVADNANNNNNNPLLRKKSLDESKMFTTVTSSQHHRMSTASFSANAQDMLRTSSQGRPKSMMSSPPAPATSKLINFSEFDKYTMQKEQFEDYLKNQVFSSQLNNTKQPSSNNNNANQPMSNTQSSQPKLVHTTTSLRYHLPQPPQPTQSACKNESAALQSPSAPQIQQNPSSSASQSTYQSQVANKQFTLSGDKQLKYIEKLESDFDLLMKHKQQLDSQLTRMPQKLNNTNLHIYKENIESELGFVEKKLASVKLELRKLNIIKSH